MNLINEFLETNECSLNDEMYLLRNAFPRKHYRIHPDEIETRIKYGIDFIKSKEVNNPEKRNEPMGFFIEKTLNDYKHKIDIILRFVKKYGSDVKYRSDYYHDQNSCIRALLEDCDRILYRLTTGTNIGDLFEDIDFVFNILFNSKYLKLDNDSIMNKLLDVKKYEDFVSIIEKSMPNK